MGEQGEPIVHWLMCTCV